MKNNIEDTELTKGQVLAGNLIAGAYTVLCGLFLLLVGLGLFDGLTVGLVFLTTAIIQRNTVSLWLSFAFIVPAAVSYLNNFTALSYAQLYPLYIAIPAIASLFTMFMSKAYSDHIKIVIFFGVTAAVFSLQSSSVVGWGVVIPVLVVIAGLAIVYTAIKMNASEDGDE